MSRVLVLGDIHGAYKALKQVLERSNFNYEEDILIQLGDVVDGWNEVYECIEELLKIKNLIPIIGNHDDWFREYLEKGLHPTRWLQGGNGTLNSYAKNADREINVHQSMGAYITNLTTADIPQSHIDFFTKEQTPFYIDKNRCFVHGGFDREFTIEEQHYLTLCWDRELWNKALSAESWGQAKIITADDFDEIYIGHTTTENWKTTKPIKAAQVWNLDTGAGWSGKLTIMDVNTKEYWQSDLVQELYPNERGRRN